MKRGRYVESDSEEENESEDSYDADAVAVEDMSYQEVRHALKLRGVKPTGKKAALVEQLLELRAKEEATSKLRMRDMARTESSVRAWQFGLTNDVLINHVLNQLNASSLLSFGATCNAAWMLTNRESLWESLLISKNLTQVSIHKREIRDFSISFAKATLRSSEPKVRYILASTRAKCVQCFKQFSEPLNTPKSCFYHDGVYAPKNQWNREDYLWSCCQGEELDDAGCMLSSHSIDPQDAKMEGEQHDYWW